MFVRVPVTRLFLQEQLFMKESTTPTWLKSKGYLHLTPQIDVLRREKELLSKIQNEKFIAKYGFYPLIYSSIDDRKYKKSIVSENPLKIERKHSFKNTEGKFVKNIKSRPLHYATHMDALIFGYYAELLQDKYEELLKPQQDLSECIIAYRKIPIGDGSGKNKGTIHFANEVFEEVKKRATNEECTVLTFDIKSFFPSLNHTFLKEAWCKLLGVERLPEDHYNVFNASTKFSYILMDELRAYQSKNGRRAGFDEKKLAKIRNDVGVNCFFESSKEFKEKVKNKELRVYKYPFWDKENRCPIGIPQGLPISTILANLYLLEFDLEVYQKLVVQENCYYRRYSDDIVIICNNSQSSQIKDFVKDSIKAQKVKISEDKTEEFIFERFILENGDTKLRSVKITSCERKTDVPLIYLGFEFYGERKAIKSSNLSKFYRRMIQAIKSKSRIALKEAESKPDKSPIIFRRQLYRLYSTINLRKTNIRTKFKRIVKTEKGNYRTISIESNKKLKSNYFTYIDRASEIMDAPSIKRQLRNHKKIFNQAVFKHFYSKIKKV